LSNTINLEFDPRVMSLLARDLYKERLSFLRELIQNSYDAGANEINWIIDYDNKTITEEDNGRGMSYDFLISDFRRIGKSFKTSSDQIGFYGIGRLSIWLVADRATIRTKDAFLSWDEISSYNVEKTDNEYKGLRFTIHIKDEHESILSKWRILNYIEDNIILPINITVKEVSSHKTLSESSFSNSSFQYPYTFYDGIGNADVYLKPNSKYSSYIYVYEHGLKITSKYSSSVSAIINYHKKIRTLSRESITISDNEIFQTLSRAYKHLARSLSSEELESLNKGMSKVASRLQDTELASLVVVNHHPLKYYRSNSYMYSRPSTLISKARSMGINVIVSDNDAIINCMELLGIQPLSSIKDQLRDTFILSKARDEIGVELLKQSNKYLEKLRNYTLEAYNKVDTSSIGKIVKDMELSKVESSIKSMDLAEAKVINDPSSKELILYGNTGFGYSDEEIDAWTSQGRIFLNLNSNLVKTALETRRFDILQETLIHEYVHLLGYLWHDNDFMTVYSYLIDEISIDRARRTHLAEVEAGSLPPDLLSKFDNVNRVRIEIDPID